VTIYKLNYTVLSALIYNSFGHLTLMLLLHYFVKCRLLNRLFASGVSVSLAFVLEEDILHIFIHRRFGRQEINKE